MGLRINTNTTSLGVQSALNRTSGSLSEDLKKVSSGSNFSNTSSNSADYSLAQSLKAQIASVNSARKNSENASSLFEAAQSGLSEQTNLLVRMRELATQSASDTYSDSDRSLANSEQEQLNEEFNRVAESTSYGKQKLLAGDNRNYSFQVGPNNKQSDRITFNSDANTTSSNLNVDSIDISSRSGAVDSLEKIDSALDKISENRAKFGAMQSRFSSVESSSSDLAVALQDGLSKVEDTDYAKTTSDVAKNQALMKYQMYALQQSNDNTANLVRLVG